MSMAQLVGILILTFSFMKLEPFSHLFVFSAGKDMEFESWAAMYDDVPKLLTDSDRYNWLKQFNSVALGSDAFFPFRDNVDRARQVSIPKYIPY